MFQRRTRVGMIGVLVLTAGCDPAVRTGTSAVELVVDRLEAAAGGTNTFGTVLQSDVPSSGTPQPDLGRVRLRVRMRDPGPAGAPAAPSPMNVVTITRYRVAFRRSDGPSREGHDVPHAVDGAVTVTVDESPTQMAFTLVRAQAKLEPPLRALVHGGGAVVLSTFADVSFYGRDARGRDVTARASLTVHFADWRDEGLTAGDWRRP